MAHKRKNNTTKLEIIQMATKMFLENGYSHTSIKAISDALDISTGNLTFYFHTKEHLLAVLVEELCDFQWKMMDDAVNKGKTSLLAVCLELAAMASICEENEIVKDFYFSAYTHKMSLELIRKSDKKRAKMVFASYCKDWTDEHFAEAEILVSGIEYGTLMTTEDEVSLDVRIAGALDSIMMLYNVPKEKREEKIQKILEMDYRAIGKSIFLDFMAYIEKANEQALEKLLTGQSKR